MDSEKHDLPDHTVPDLISREVLPHEQCPKGQNVPYWKQFIDGFKIVNSDYVQTDFNSSESVIAERTKTEVLKRRLTNRHIQMIAFGGAIGTGLFIGSGGALAAGGPASLIIGYLLVGTMLFNVVMALGELAVVFPIPGSFMTYASRFIDPAWGFSMGWNYVLASATTLPLELTAAAITIRYWNETLNPGIWISIFWFAIVFINFFGVKGYGEAEFLFSMTKIIAVIGFVILAVVIDVGGVPGDAGGYRGAKTWTDPGPFRYGFKGFVSIFVSAAFAFSGTETVGLTAAESDNPRKNLPRATKQVFWRISLFYIISLFLIGLIVPYDNNQLLGNQNNTSSDVIDVAASPFVIAIHLAGIKILPSVFNGVILVSVLSVGNSSVYSTSRILSALAHDGQAPRWLGLVDRQGRPIFAVLVSLAIGGLAFISESGKDASNTVFNWLLALSGLSVLFTWGSICWCHIRFRTAWAKNGHSLDELPFKAAFGVVGSWYGCGLIVVILIAQFYLAVWPVGYEDQAASDRANNFFQAYLAAPVVVLAYAVWKFYKKTPFMVVGSPNYSGTAVLRTDTIDVDTGRKDWASEMSEEEKENAGLAAWRRYYRALCG